MSPQWVTAQDTTPDPTDFIGGSQHNQGSSQHPGWLRPGVTRGGTTCDTGGSELQEFSHEGSEDLAEVLHGGWVQVALVVLGRVPDPREGQGDEVQHGDTCGDTEDGGTSERGGELCGMGDGLGTLGRGVWGRGWGGRGVTWMWDMGTQDMGI